MSKTVSHGTVHKLPVDLRRALTADSAALAIWEGLTPLARNEWMELLQALGRLDGEANGLPRLLTHLEHNPTLSAALLMLQEPPERWPSDAWPALRAAVAHAAKPLQRYRCAACGFEAQHYFWQCPGCPNWDSYPPQRIDAL